MSPDTSAGGPSTPGQTAQDREFAVTEVIGMDERQVESGFTSPQEAVDRARQLTITAEIGVYFDVRDSDGRVWWTGESTESSDGDWFIQPDWRPQ